MRENLDDWKGVDQVEMIQRCHKSIHCKDPRVPGPGNKLAQFVFEWVTGDPHFVFSICCEGFEIESQFSRIQIRMAEKIPLPISTHAMWIAGRPGT